MKISESWLREWVDPPVDTRALAEQLTMAGLEVDAVEPVAGKFSGVIVGEIVSAKPHPDAEKLQVCEVDPGNGNLLQIVCGAPNARPGIKVPLAQVGAVLPENFKIKKAKLRGVESQGMLCAQTELQAGDDDSGLWVLPLDAPVGEELQKYLKLYDQVIEVDLTPNRGDCLSMRGIAREVAVLNKSSLQEPNCSAVKTTINETFPVTITAAEQCPRYIGRVVRNIDVSQPSPLWLQERLRRAGLRSIDCIVDVTNYVLLELGQPLHAFDLEKLNKAIDVRLAKEGEQITLLDGQCVKLQAGTLVICDQSGPIAMAGIMGGQSTAVSETTKHIFFESAYFSPDSILGKARSYGLHTDSSHRFERGVDYGLQEQAVERATQLLLDIAGGEAGPLVIKEASEFVPTQKIVSLRRDRIGSGLGVAIDDNEVVDILTRLGLTQIDGALNNSRDGWSFTVPSHRFDISIEEDLLEELARIYGYNKLPVNTLTAKLQMSPHAETTLNLRQLKAELIARDYNEVITYSFVSKELSALIDPDVHAIPLLNPLSADLAVMRTSLWPGLVQTLVYNINRQQTRARLFECGMRFTIDTSSNETDGQGKIRQESMIAGLICGPRADKNWTETSESVDFFDIKGDVEALLTPTGQAGEFTFSVGSHPALHPGQCALINRNGAPVGCLGALHPRIQRQLEIERPVILFEVLQSALLIAKLPEFKEISKFPEVRRDIAFVVDKNLQIGPIMDKVRVVAGDYLEDLKVFDLYSGKGIDPHRKSVALGLTFQHPSRTLNESEINASVEKVVQTLQQDFGATLR